MPVLGNIISQRAQRERISATNKIELAPGWWDGLIKDVWIFNVDAEGKYTKERTGEQKCEIKVALLDENRQECGIVLSRRCRAYLSKGSQFGKIIESLTGLAAGSDEQKNFDTDELVGMEVEVQTVQSGEYVNIEGMKPKQKARPAPAPAAAQRPAPAPRPATAPTHRADAGAFDDDDFAGYERR